MNPSPLDTRDPLTATILALFRANGHMLRWGDHFAQPFDLTSARWQMLGALAASPLPLTAPQMAIQMGVSRQGALKQLNLLLDDGLVERHPNPYHKRSPLYRLSASGLERYQRIDAAWSRHADQVRADFDLEALNTTLHVLKKIQERHPTQEDEGEAA
ncbi:MAG: winged helix-turn-helix transcriptional regulator [Magnetococcales bacterium]|nr:winged helix-turn-helix transcriptional regulator [Magnetococcales bacterium]